jgi:hypothetical protein
MTKTNDDQFSAAATNLDQRASALGQQLTNPAAGPTATLIESLAVFIRTLGKASAAADRVSDVIIGLTIAGVLIGGLNILFVWLQMNDAEKIAQGQNAISLNGQVFHDEANRRIIGAIEAGKPILIKNHGQMTELDLDNYLADLGIVESTFHDGQITEKQFCYDFAYYVTNTFKNAEVLKYLNDNPGFYAGLLDLRSDIARSKLEDCH